MSKAISVVYVPEEYSEQLDRLSIEYSLFYHDENDTVKQVDVESRCPLKPIPEKAKYTFKKTSMWWGICKGWNACIDEILGEKE